MAMSTAAARGGPLRPPSGIQSGARVAVSSAACGSGSSRSLIRSIRSSAADTSTRLLVLAGSEGADVALDAGRQRLVVSIEQHAGRVDRARPFDGAGRRHLPAERTVVV